MASIMMGFNENYDFSTDLQMLSFLFLLNIPVFFLLDSILFEDQT